MTTQELAQQILTIAQQAIEQEQRVAIYMDQNQRRYIDDDPDKCPAHVGLETIITLCKGVLPAQEDFRHYEKKVRHENSKG